MTDGGGSAGNYAGFDALGRTLRKYQQTDSVNYLIEAAYSISFMTSETYPSVPGAGDRRTVTYTPDAAGRLASLNSNATTYAPAASVSSIGYASHNALNTETYGNSLIHAISYNNRLQANEIKLGTSGAPTSALDLTYNYGTTNNNGNVQSLTYAGGGLSYTQNFGYDSLNRLTAANENSGASWSQTNGYDQYGNRWIDYGGGVHNLAFSTSNNRITTAGFSYDANGNLTNDTVHAYTFDAENQIKTVAAVNAYTYDGEGQRVRKLVGENTRFVYGLGGQLIAEFDGSTGNLKKEYLYGGATLITIEPTAVNSNGTQYTTLDNLGSARAITNASGSVVSRHDYMPFGEELCAGTGGRTTGMGFCAGGDTNRKKFTGYERDAETGLDFAQARYFSSTEGRFISADSLLGSLANPQSLNRYSYVVNNPLNSTDPSGHLPVSATGSGPGSWGGFEGPEPGDLPERYEDEIANIKAVIAENAAARNAATESAPEHVDEEGHSGDEATGGGEHEAQSPPVLFLTAQLLSNDTDPQVLCESKFEPTGFGTDTATLNVETDRGPAALSGDIFTVRANFLLPEYTKLFARSTGDSGSRVILGKDNRYRFPTEKEAPFGSSYAFFDDGNRRGHVDITLKVRDIEATKNSIFVTVAGVYENGQLFSGQASLKLIGNNERPKTPCRQR